jgi:hypothetical protein
VVPGYLAPTLLAAEHNVDDFNCGKEPLDLFLKRFARQNQKKGSSRTYVTLRPPYRRVCPPNTKIPVMLLARLAVDATYRPPAQKLGLGESFTQGCSIQDGSACKDRRSACHVGRCHRR